MRRVHIFSLGFLATLALACSKESRVASEVDAGTGPVAEAGRLPLPNHAPVLACFAPLDASLECSRDADCADGLRCVAADAERHRDRAPFPLVCAEPRGPGKERDRCASSEDCESGICALSDVCLAPCSQSSDCARGQACVRVEARFAQGLEPVMACARTLAFSKDVRIEKPRREQNVDANILRSLRTPAIEGDVLSFLRTDCTTEAQVRGLRRVGSTTPLFDLEALLDGEPSQNPVANSGRLIPLLVPNNPDVENRGDGYEIDLVPRATTDVDVVVVSRSGEHQILDVNLFYVGGGEERTSGGFRPGDEAMRTVLSRVDERMRAYGLRLGTIREHDVVGALRDELSVLDTEIVLDEDQNPVDLRINRLDEVFELSAGVDDGGINLFLLSDMGDVLGISGGIPGALGVPGTSASGVAVAVDVVGLAALPSVIFHETCHHLGLFHTSELDGFVIEPLSDTPECRPAQDADEDGILSSRECRNHGADNLMFWAGSGTELSEQQAEVLRRSVVLR